MRNLPCTVEEARVEIETILDSGIFARSSRQAKLLEYLFEKLLSGEAAELKEYTIAVEVFDKSESFGQHADATVRVEAHRLRKKLKRYYETQGRHRPFQVGLPAGHYHLSFESVGDSRGGGWRAGWFGLGIRSAAYAGTAVVVLILAVFFYFGRSDESVPGISARVPATVYPSDASAMDDPEPEATRVLVGHSGEPHVDSAGRRWLSDRFFEGGRIRPVSPERISRTGHPDLFRQVREGGFRYRVPLSTGRYEMWLYFVDPDGPIGELLARGRVFEVVANGKSILQGYDVAASAGYNADVLAFAHLETDKDGILDLEFNSIRSHAVVSAIELLRMRGPLPRPIRIVAQSHPYQDLQHRFWAPDDFYSGGRVDGYTAMIEGGSDPGIFSGERFGNFEYFIPVPAGEYRLNLYFGESWFGPGQYGSGSTGSRVFDVLLNYQLVLNKLDLLREGPPKSLICKTFRNVKPGRFGKIHLIFSSQTNWAEIRAIEIEPEEPQLLADP